MPTLTKAENAKKASRSRRDKKSAIKTDTAELIKADPDFLQKLKLCWQLGDWIAIEAFAEQDIKLLEGSGECALYISAACFQLSFLDKAKTFQALALQWGATKQQVARVLVSGAYNTLGTASIIANRNVSTTALQHFSMAAQIALPGVAVTSLIKARTQNQLDYICSQVDFARPADLQIRSNTTTSMITTSPEAVKEQLQQNYIFDANLNVWRRSQPYEFTYNDGDEIEQRIFAAVKACEDVSIFSRELLQHQTDWASEYHLSADRVNLLRPFTNQLKDAQVLELGCGCGAITRFLGESGACVTAVEGSQQRAAIAAERCRDLNDVTIILDKLQDVPFHQQFDVVTLIGVLEYSRVYVEAEDPIQYVLEKARSYLKPNGVLIVAIENQLGLKYFAGAPEDHGVGIMAGINDAYGANTPVTFGKQELERRFIKAGFTKCDTYLPFPDYKLPCVIVHPAGCLHHDRFDLSNLLAGSPLYDRQGIAAPLFSLEASWPVISRNGLAADLANSHLFMVHNTASTWTQSDEVLVSYYSPKRIAETSKELTICLQGQDVLVNSRQMNNKEATSAVTTEPYVSGALHSQLLHKIVQKPGWTLEQLEEWLQLWLNALEQALVKPTNTLKDWPSYDKWLPENYIDAIPRNLIISDNGYSQFIDLEWLLPHQLPLPLVLYRGLLVTFSSLTSIAPPADATWVQGQTLLEALMAYSGYNLTAQDYQFFVPVMQNLLRKAQGLAPVTAISDEAIKLNLFKVRPQVNALQDRSNCMTLYWRSVDAGFCEEHATKHIYNKSGDRQRISLNIPPQPAEYSRFRLDIAEKPGCYQLNELTLCDNNDEEVWRWDFNVNRLTNIGYLSFFHSPNSNGICLISDGYDPQFELNLPQQVLTAISGGGTMIIDMRAYT
jgi:2-polyprenyl-3-methyl-5-hydroxy-6-metoxy-1,4-benzoquinol methylase